jgi:hypothetical protein
MTNPPDRSAVLCENRRAVLERLVLAFPGCRCGVAVI